MSIGAIVLDLEGVYFEDGTTRFTDLLMSYGHGRNVVNKVYADNHLMRQYKKGRVPGGMFWKHLIGTLKLPETKESLLERMAEGYQENTPLVEWTQKLRQQGIIIAACSNTYKERIELLERKFGFLANFDVTAFSYEREIQCLKPNPQIFNVLAKRIGLPKGSILMFDDKMSNVLALRGFGFQATQYISAPQAMKEYERLR